MEMKVCQSCGMPMGNTDELYGTNKDGSKSADYCKYCYQDGAFTFQGTMQEMMDFCVKPMLESDPNMTESQARGIMASYFPMLKRWRKA